MEKKKVTITKKAFSDEIKGNYLMSPNEIIVGDKYKLKDLEKYVLLYFIANTDLKTKRCYTSIKNICYNVHNVYNESKRVQISKVIKSLKDKVLINVSTETFNDENSSTFYSKNSYSLNINIKEHYTWEKIPKTIIFTDEFEWKEKLFIIQIYHLVYYTSNYIAYTRNKIAKELGMSYTTASKKLDNLIEKGLIDEVNGKFVFHFDKLFAMSEEVIENLLKKLRAYQNKESIHARYIKEIKILNGVNDKLKEMIVNNLSRMQRGDGDKYRHIVDTEEELLHELSKSYGEKRYIKWRDMDINDKFKYKN